MQTVRRQNVRYFGWQAQTTRTGLVYKQICGINYIQIVKRTHKQSTTITTQNDFYSLAHTQTKQTNDFCAVLCGPPNFGRLRIV